ncbi:hypothetical protein Musp01_15360 [Muricauda sp. NBRC 101325]|nr:hypothetical protein Musp01_15360 [Muricauda sp. NBRC 101325]
MLALANQEKGRKLGAAKYDSKYPTSSSVVVCLLACCLVYLFIKCALYTFKIKEEKLEMQTFR